MSGETETKGILMDNFDEEELGDLENVDIDDYGTIDQEKRENESNNMRMKRSSVKRFLTNPNACITCCLPCFHGFNFVISVSQFFCLFFIFLLILGFGIGLACRVYPEAFGVKDRDVIGSTLDTVRDVAKSLGLYTQSNTYPPTLILQITIDQFRADELLKYRKRFKPNKGFDRMMKNGILYRNAHYRHSRCVTPIGHSCLHTGGLGFSHGIIAHSFLDPKLQKIVGSVENLNYNEVSGLENITGTAPTYLISTTTGDELRLFTNESKVFSVSEKDYVAILQSGHMGQGFWFSTQTGRFISSNYFMSEYPKWVNDWNAKKVPDSYSNSTWELSYPQNEYHYQNRKYVHPGYKMGKKFPKPLHNENKQDFYGTLLQSPIGDFITWDFVKGLILEEKLGKRKDNKRGNIDNEIVDFLAISFSSLDKIGHACGPNSLESEDTIYKLDELLGQMFDWLDDYIGLDNVLIALSADHGVDDSWEHFRDLRFETASEIYTQEQIPLLEEYLNETVFEGKLEKSVILGFPSSNLYFHQDVIKAHGKTSEEVQRAAAEWLQEKEEVLFAFTKADMAKGFVPRTIIGDSAILNFHPDRTGDVQIFVQEHVFLGDHRGNSSTTHGTPWSYDSYVPIMFMGRDVPQNVIVDRRVSPEDVAPTITTYFGINAPSGCTGNPLPEVLKDHSVNSKEN